MKIQYRSTSPKGGAEIDTSRLVVGTDGRAYLMGDGRIVPAMPEAIDALAAQFGATWRDALDAVKALR